MYKYVFDINIEYQIIPVNNVINKLVYINKYSNISTFLLPTFCSGCSAGLSQLSAKGLSVKLDRRRRRTNGGLK